MSSDHLEIDHIDDDADTHDTSCPNLRATCRPDHHKTHEGGPAG